jgi:tRNA(fMet)-specific endonuclease VapC
MILLDTDMVTLLHGPASAARDSLIQQLEAAADAGEDVVVSIISFEEQMRGWLAHISRAKDPVKQVVAYERLRRLLNHYCGMRILDFDGPASSRFATFGPLNAAPTRWTSRSQRSPSFTALLFLAATPVTSAASLV